MSKVILFRGKAGVGKTTVSNIVGKTLNIPIIRKDDIYDSISGYIDNHEMINKACYNTIYKILDTNITNGVDVIVDAGFHYMDQVLNFKTWVTGKKADFVPLLCVCSDEELWKQRFNRRRMNPQANNLIIDFEQLKLHYGDLVTHPLDNEIILDTVDNLDSLKDKAIVRINR